MGNWLLGGICVIACTASAIAQDGVIDRDRLEYFETHVRPLLVSKCLECHSHRTEINGGLSLDSRSDWTRGGDSGTAIQPDDWKSSLIWKAIEYRDPNLQMPPNGRLTEREMEIFRHWLSTGAFDPRSSVGTSKKQVGLPVSRAQEHWSYRAVHRDIVPPSVSDDHPIDAFLGMEASRLGLSTNPLVNDSVFMQRVSTDLLGMRPTQEELDRASGLAPDQLIDAVLSSPKFGEHFARHWMDVARFAESLTLRGLVFQDAWRYRQYLIDSFNADKPFDTFVREQIAGDLMESNQLEERQQQWIATTMLTLGDTNMEEQDKKQLEMDYVDEQLDVIGKAFLAQTFGCARCHDHKFDPIPTKDYYALAGILKSSVGIEHSNVSNWVRLPLPLEPDEESRFEVAEKEVQSAKKELDTLKKQLAKKPGQAPSVSVEQLAGVVIDDSAATKIGGWTKSAFQPRFVGDGYVHDDHEVSVVKSITFEPKELPQGRYVVKIAFNPGQNRATNTTVRIFSADGEDLVRINQRKAPREDGLWHPLGEYSFETGGRAAVEISNAGANGHVIADAVQFLRVGEESSKTDDSDEPGIDVELVKGRIAELEKELKSKNEFLATRPRVMSLKLGAAKDLPIHVRGTVHQLGDVVPRGFLSCVQIPGTTTIDPASNGRLELANWLASPHNPLTARVYVNRVWSWLMGQGIVRTVDNFGTTGEEPSNPELLDWLTNAFVKNGWSTKWLVKTIVMSKAYRRTANTTREQRERDPENRTFSRSHVRRLTPETMRDTLLSVSGELQAPPSRDRSTIPDGLKEDYRFPHQSLHRTVYGPWFRNSTPELFAEFDGANPSFSMGSRGRSTVAPQALLMMNSDWIAKRADNIAAKLLRGSELKNREERIGQLFILLLGRAPSSEEISWARAVLDQESSESYSLLVQQMIASIDFRFVE
jgi:hypothetical protein